VSSIKPNDRGGKVYGGQKVALGFIVTCGDGPKLLELGEEILD
jgi:hypothetical protein